MARAAWLASSPLAIPAPSPLPSSPLDAAKQESAAAVASGVDNSEGIAIAEQIEELEAESEYPISFPLAI